MRSWLGEVSKNKHSATERFEMTKYDSDAAGLRYKMITLKNRFLIPSGEGGEKQPSVPEKGYAVRYVSSADYAA